MLFIACDHAGFILKEKLLPLLKKNQIAYQDLSSEYIAGDDYPDAAQILAQKMIQEADNNLEQKEQTQKEELQKRQEVFGLAICGTGQGICMALNRYPQIRAGLALDLETIRLLREHNGANILCLPGNLFKSGEKEKWQEERKIEEKTEEKNKQTLEHFLALIQAFLQTKPSQEERHLRRRQKLETLP